MKGIVIRSFVEIINGNKKGYSEGQTVEPVDPNWIAAGFVVEIPKLEPIERAVKNPKERAIAARKRAKATLEPKEKEEIYGAEADHSPGS